MYFDFIGTGRSARWRRGSRQCSCRPARHLDQLKRDGELNFRAVDLTGLGVVASWEPAGPTQFASDGKRRSGTPIITGLHKASVQYNQQRHAIGTGSGLCFGGSRSPQLDHGRLVLSVTSGGSGSATRTTRTTGWTRRSRARSSASSSHVGRRRQGAGQSEAPLSGRAAVVLFAAARRLFRGVGVSARSESAPADSDCAATERAGFEPATRLSTRTRFPVALLRPLGHLSGRATGYPLLCASPGRAKTPEGVRCRGRTSPGATPAWTRRRTRRHPGSASRPADP